MRSMRASEILRMRGVTHAVVGGRTVHSMHSSELRARIERDRLNTIRGREAYEVVRVECGAVT